MTKILDEVLAANTKYAENFGDKGNLPLPPSRHFAILTCMDARLHEPDSTGWSGLSRIRSALLRAASGVACSVMRSLR